MNIDIRAYIKNNFKNASTKDINSSIEEALKKRDDLTLPGLGVLFEIMWNASDAKTKDQILNKLQNSFK